MPMGSPLYQPFPMLAGRRAQVWQHQPQYRRPRHFHEEPEINLVLAGTALLGVGDHVLSLSRGDLVFLHPGQDHELLEASPDLDLFVMALTPELAERAWGKGAPTSTAHLTLQGGELAATAELLLHLRETRDGAALERELGDVFERGCGRLAKMHVSSRRALFTVRKDPALSGHELAERLRTTPSELSRRFHRDLGVSFVEYRARLRLMRFIRLVDAGASFSHAALEADFGSYVQCHRVFGRTLGCAPREYFASLRAGIDARVWLAP